MKHKYSLKIASAVIGLAATLFAVERQAGRTETQTIHLKANGETFAEVRLLKGTRIHTMKGQNLHHYVVGPRTTAKGGVMIEMKNGENVVTIKADEVEVVTDSH